MRSTALNQIKTSTVFILTNTPVNQLGSEFLRILLIIKNTLAVFKDPRKDSYLDKGLFCCE